MRKDKVQKRKRKPDGGQTHVSAKFRKNPIKGRHQGQMTTSVRQGTVPSFQNCFTTAYFPFYYIPSVYACWPKCLQIESKSSGLQAAENKDSVHLRFAFPPKAPIKYPKPEDVAITSTAMTGGTKGIILYQLQKDKIFDHTKIDFASLTLPTLVKSTEPKPK